MNNCTHTRMLEFLCALLDLILGTSICDHHQHLRDVPPHAAVWGEHLLIDVLQSDTWMEEEEDHNEREGSGSIKHLLIWGI